MNSIARIVDIILSCIGILLTLPLMILIAALVFVETKSPLFLQTRIGKNKKSFKIVKFRTMRVATPSVATHLVSSEALTHSGKYLRKWKLDELPQFFNVLIGDMSFVGPRPNLPNQSLLIEERDKRNIYLVRPGITGLAQIKGIDMASPKLLAEHDEQMIHQFSTKMYFLIILHTVSGKGMGDRISN